jgi:hypothetical protein
MLREAAVSLLLLLFSFLELSFSFLELSFSFLELSLSFLKLSFVRCTFFKNESDRFSIILNFHIQSSNNILIVYYLFFNFYLQLNFDLLY